MRIKRAAEENFSLVMAVLIIFTAGIIFGALAVFQIPAEISEEAGEIMSSSLDKSVSVKDIVKNDFTTEAVWMIVIWILGTLSTMAPFIAAAIAMRGFIIGFSSAFIISERSGEAVKLLCAYVAPQCVLSLPVMTVFSIMCIRSCMDRKSGEATDSRYFAMGLIFMAVSFAASISESAMSRFFIHYL